MNEDLDNKIWDEIEFQIININDNDIIIPPKYNSERISNNDRNDLIILEPDEYDTNPSYSDEERMYKQMYESSSLESADRNTNYSNLSFCNFCRNQVVIPFSETDNFINAHRNINSIKYKKYLLPVFRLCPFLFDLDFVMSNKLLRGIVYNHLGIIDNFKNNPLERMEHDVINDYAVYNNYLSRIRHDKTHFVFEIYFHQPELQFSDYVKCNICKSYLCPLHFYISNSHCVGCKYCDKKWLICSNCKPVFNEFYACKYIHKN